MSVDKRRPIHDCTPWSASSWACSHCTAVAGRSPVMCLPRIRSSCRPRCAAHLRCIRPSHAQRGCHPRRRDRFVERGAEPAQERAELALRRCGTVRSRRRRHHVYDGTTLPFVHHTRGVLAPARTAPRPPPAPRATHRPKQGGRDSPRFPPSGACRRPLRPRTRRPAYLQPARQYSLHTSGCRRYGCRRGRFSAASMRRCNHAMTLTGVWTCRSPAIEQTGGD